MHAVENSVSKNSFIQKEEAVESRQVIAYLIGIQFNIYQGHSLVYPVIVPCNTVNSIGDKFKYKIQVKFFFICC